MSKDSREFILVAEDCPRKEGTVPYNERGSDRTVAMDAYEVLSQHPYEYTEDELKHEVYVVRRHLKNFDPDTRDLKRNDLPKRWGWGFHYNQDRKVALFGCETEEYEQLAKKAQARGTAESALRNKRA